MEIRDWILIGLAFPLLIGVLLEIRHKVLVQRLKQPKDPTLWKWGIIYFNPEDTRIVVPKRIESLGWTLNFARPSSYGFIIGLILVVILLSAA